MKWLLWTSWLLSTGRSNYTGGDTLLMEEFVSCLSWLHSQFVGIFISAEDKKECSKWQNLSSNYKIQVQCLWDSACKFYHINKSWWEELSWWSLFLHNFFLFLFFRNLQEVWGKFENATFSFRLFFFSSNYC